MLTIKNPVVTPEIHQARCACREAVVSLEDASERGEDQVNGAGHDWDNERTSHDDGGE